MMNTNIDGILVKKLKIKIPLKDVIISGRLIMEWELIANWILNTGRFIICSGIRRIYYRKTVGHVFTKPVQIEEKLKKFFPVSYFSS